MAKTETVRHELYGGRIVIDFYPNSHRYKLISVDGVEKGDWLKSPSSIVSKLDKSGALIHWAVGCFYDKVVEEMRDGANFTKDDVLSMLALGKQAHAEKKQAAASVGTVVHAYAQNHNEISDIEKIDGFLDLTEEDQAKARAGAQAFDDWYKMLGGKSVQSEFLVYSLKHGYVGTCDDLVQLNTGEHIILDYKTSKGVYTEQIYQVTAYMKAKEEENPEIKIAGARLIHLIKDDVLDKDGNIIKRAGEYGEVYLSRANLVTAYKVFKALKVIADNDPKVQKLLGYSI